MAEIRWDVSKADSKLIGLIADRAIAVYLEYCRLDVCEPRITKRDIEMDLAAAHLNGCPLKLEALLTADDFNFSHDVFGIGHHISHKTGHLARFLPRFAVGETAAA